MQTESLPASRSTGLSPVCDSSSTPLSGMDLSIIWPSPWLEAFTSHEQFWHGITFTQALMLFPGLP